MEFRDNIGFHKQKKSVNKAILFPINKKFDSTSQNEGLVKKIYPLREKAAFTGRNIYKTRKKWLPILGERLLYKEWLRINFNNGFL